MGRRLVLIVLLLIVPGLPALPAHSVLAAGPVVTGPAQGALVIVGGGKVGNEILTRMFDLAGGKDVLMVVIPTASGAEDYPADWPGLRMFKTFGATNITLLHTKDRKVADSEAFVKPITSARLVWFVGGRQWRLVDSYANTRTQREIENVLARGGSIDGVPAIDDGSLSTAGSRR